MERIDGVVGNVHADDDLATLHAAHKERGTLERIVVDAGNRRRSRFRATTDAGTDVGVTLDKPAVSAGDVLFVDDNRMIVVVFEPRDAIAITLPDATDEALAAAIELGHRVGNQHWDLAVDDGTVYVPLEADYHIVERVVTDVVSGAEIRETTVEADLFVTEIEGEGGGSDEPVDHTHKFEHGHDVGDHTHDHGTEHAHDHTHDH